LFRRIRSKIKRYTIHTKESEEEKCEDVEKEECNTIIDEVNTLDNLVL
jgi:hypothetical protein